MVMSWIFAGMTALAIICGAVNGCTDVLAGAAAAGAQSGITLALSLGGSICLWTGVGKLLERSGITKWASQCLAPLMNRLFPSAARDPVLAGYLSGNLCANLFGLGNAATPMGLQAVGRMQAGRPVGIASHEMCRLVVLNTASIQLIPTTVAAVRMGLGCAKPFDILPAVWVTSLCSAGAGLAAAWVMGRLCRD